MNAYINARLLIVIMCLIFLLESLNAKPMDDGNQGADSARESAFSDQDSAFADAGSGIRNVKVNVQPKMSKSSSVTCPIGKVKVGNKCMCPSYSTNVGGSCA